MLAFEISLNGKKLATAGMKEAGVVTTHITWFKGRGPRGPKQAVEETDLHVAGFYSATRRHVRWAQRPLKKGDTVRIEVVDAVKISKSKVSIRETPKQRLQREQDHMRKKAKEWGWTISAAGPRI
jgi:hypothetical protein